MDELIAKDIFGNVIESGDFFLYCPGSKRNAPLRLGVFIDIAFPNKRVDGPKKNKRMDEVPSPNVRVKLINDYGSGEVLSYIDVKTFSQRAALLSNPEFSINSALIKRAIQIRDDLRDTGLIGRINERVSVNSEGNQ